MMPINEQEIRQIVSRVVKQAMGGPQPAPSQASAEKPAAATQPQETKTLPGGGRTVAIGADHGGFEMKEKLKKQLADKGFTVIDCGANDTSSVDYPDFAAAVARLVSRGEAWRGVMIDGAGIGSCMAANKVPGVRAALCYDYATAVNSREHNDANLLTLGAGLIGLNQARLILDTWLATDFGGGRHAKRVDKIMALEKSEMKAGK